MKLKLHFSTGPCEVPERVTCTERRPRTYAVTKLCTGFSAEKKPEFPSNSERVEKVMPLPVVLPLKYEMLVSGGTELSTVSLQLCGEVLAGLMKSTKALPPKPRTLKAKSD